MTFPQCCPEDHANFKKNGYLHVKNFFDPDSCLAICRGMESLDPTIVKAFSLSKSTFIEPSDQKGEPYSGLTYLQKASFFIPEVCGAKNLPLLNFSAKLLEVNDAFFMEDEVHIRQPISSHEIPAHQDNFYFSLQNPKALTCYVYLTNQDRNSGGLGFLPSDISSTTDDHDSSNAVGFSSYNKTIESDRKEEFDYPATCSGDVVFHHSNTYHRAFSNATNFPTSSLSIRVFSSSNLLKNQLLQDKYLANLSSNRS